jgi:DNA primase
MITDSTVQEIMDASKIEEVVGEFVQLKRRGSNLIGLCPFHQEKTPSFSVSPSKNIFKCFGCGKGGSPVQFIMDYDQSTFLDALKFLAKKYGITIQESIITDDKREELQKNETLYLLNKFASEFYLNQMFGTDRGKSIGLSYFKSRGFLDQTIQKFSLGFADSLDSQFYQHAIKIGYSEEILAEAGLIKENRDFFRNRVIFPIHNASGKIAGFAGRILDSTLKTAKYLNSPETPIYNKSKILYGFSFAKQAIRKYDECILVEGYTDVISLHQAGFENVVATSGTSLTVDQIQLIKRHTEYVKFIFDGDVAGIKAAMRGIDMVLEQNLNVKILLLPENNDPDSYIKTYGKEKFNDLIQQEATDFIVFKTKLLLDEINGDPIKKATLVKDIISSVALIPDPIKRSIYVKECNQLLDVGEDVLISELNKVTRGKSVPKEVNKINVPANPILNDEFQERDLARILVSFGGSKLDADSKMTVAEYILENIQDVISGFDHPTYQKIVEFSAHLISSSQKMETAVFLNHRDQEISQMTVDLISSPYEYSHNWVNKWDIFLRSQKPPEENFFKDTENMLLRFKLKKINKRISENAIQIKSSFEQGDDQYLMLVKMDTELKNIRNQIAASLGQIVL